MVVIEIVAAGLMLWMLGRAGGLARRAWREGVPGTGLETYWRPVALHLAVAVLLGFAAFGGESALLADPGATLEALGWISALAAVGAGYWLVLRRARQRARGGDGR